MSVSPWLCLKCLTPAPHDPRLSICRACRAALEARDLRWCQRCERALSSAEYGSGSPCKACRSTQQRARYKADETYRTKVNAAAVAWQRANPEYIKQRNARYRSRRWFRAAQSRQNDRRWKLYHTDPAYRAKRRAYYRRKTG